MSTSKALAHAVSNTGDGPFEPGDAVTAPTGGSTVDAEARTAITAVIDALVALGLIEEDA